MNLKVTYQEKEYDINVTRLYIDKNTEFDKEDKNKHYIFQKLFADVEIKYDESILTICVCLGTIQYYVCFTDCDNKSVCMPSYFIIKTEELTEERIISTIKTKVIQYLKNTQENEKLKQDLNDVKKHLYNIFSEFGEISNVWF